MLEVAEAVARVVGAVAPLPSERRPLDDAVGQVLAGDIVSEVTLPHWDNAAMDGYAVRGADITGADAAAPRRLRVTGTVAAGGFAAAAVGAGEAMRIMTGAPIPDGADCVVRVEDTDGGVTTVEVRRDRDVGKNVRARGEDVRAGEVVLAAGAAIGAAQAGVLASVGAAHVAVHRRPRVAFLGSGDELVGLARFDEVRTGRKIVASNTHTLRAMVRAAGGIPLDHGNAPDEPAAIRAALSRALDDAPDLIVTTAGISVGEFDHVRRVLGELGGTMDFWRVRMRPGAPVGFGALGGVPWVGLPGNPVSAMVTFELFVRPAIRRLLGHRRLFRRPEPVLLEEPVRIGAALTHFLRAVVSVSPAGERTARLTGPQGSGILTSMTRANALLVVPADRTEVAAGETLHAIPLGEEAMLAEAFTL